MKTVDIIRILIILVFMEGFLVIPIKVFAWQPATDSVPCEQKDLPDLIRHWRNKPPKSSIGNKGSLLVFPVLGSNPATGFQFGVAGQYAFKSNQPNSLYSVIIGNLTYTTNKQLMLQVKNNVYAKNDRIFLSGDWRFFIFSQSTYGLGTNAPEGGILDYQYGINGMEVDDDSLVQPMKYNQYRFHQTISWKAKDALFLGFGFHFDAFDRIVDERLDTLRRITSHYAYSKKYNFNPEKYLISGFSLNLLMDTRDNLVNAYKGYFANLNWRLNPEFLGGDYTANLLTLEWRSYHGLSKTNPRHLLAFWFLGNFSDHGKLPYLVLPAHGYDQRSRSGRGYTQGRFRGQNLVYGETEYRFPISNCGGIVGGILFANFTSTNSKDKGVNLFDYVQAGYGLGLRIMVDKKSRTNLQVDLAFGKKSSGIYFGASETF